MVPPLISPLTSFTPLSFYSSQPLLGIHSPLLPLQHLSLQRPLSDWFHPSTHLSIIDSLGFAGCCRWLQFSPSFAGPGHLYTLRPRRHVGVFGGNLLWKRVCLWTCADVKLLAQAMARGTFKYLPGRCSDMNIWNTVVFPQVKCLNALKGREFFYVFSDCSIHLEENAVSRGTIQRCLL